MASGGLRHGRRLAHPGGPIRELPLARVPAETDGARSLGGPDPSRAPTTEEAGSATPGQLAVVDAAIGRGAFHRKTWRLEYTKRHPGPPRGKCTSWSRGLSMGIGGPGGARSARIPLPARGVEARATVVSVELEGTENDDLPLVLDTAVQRDLGLDARWSTGKVNPVSLWGLRRPPADQPG